MHDLVVVQVIEGGDQLPGEVKVGLKRRRPEVLVEVLERARDVLHEDAGLFFEVVVLEVPHDVLMVDFRQYGDFLLALRLVLLAEVDLLDGGEDAVVDIERLVDPPAPAAADHLAHLPLLNPLVLAHQVILHYPVLALLQQQGNALHDRVRLLAILAALQNLGLDLLIGVHEDGVHVGQHVF